MDPSSYYNFNNNNSGRPSSSNHNTLNHQNGVQVPGGAPGVRPAVQGMGGANPSMSSTNYTSYPQVAQVANNNAYRMAATMQTPQVFGGASQPGIPGQQQQQQQHNAAAPFASPSRQQMQQQQQQAMHNARTAIPATAANGGAYGVGVVPNPLGMAGAGQHTQARAPMMSPNQHQQQQAQQPAAGQSKADLLRSMYQSGAARQRQSQAPQPSQNQPQVVQQQQQQTGAVYSQQQSQQRQGMVGGAGQATGQQHNQPQHLMRTSNNAYAGVQTSQQSSGGYTQQGTVASNQAQLYAQRNSQSAQQQQGQQQASSAPSSSSGQGGSEKKHRFRLTNDAKTALRDAVMSSIRDPNGEVDQECLLRAMDHGLPRQAILNAAQVARQRERANREKKQQIMSRQKQGQSAVAQQQQQQVVQQTQGAVVHQPASTTGGAQQMSYNQTQRVQPTTQQQQQQQQQFNQQQQQYNQSTQQQQQQYMYQNQQQSYQNQQQSYQNQQQSYQNQQQSYQNQQQQQQQQQQYQRQLQAQQQKQQQQAIEEARRKKALELQYEQQRRAAAAQAQAAAQKQAAEEKRRQQKAAAEQAERQRQLIEQKRQEAVRREMEARDTAAREAQRKRTAALISKMKPWGRTGFALAVKPRAAGLPQQQQQTSHRPLLRQSPWGGASLCKDTEPALVSALKRRIRKGSGEEGKEEDPSTTQQEAKMAQAVDLIRKRLIQQAQRPQQSDEDTLPEEPRRKRLRIISSKLFPQPDQLKRHKLQPKRESKFLDKHIRRARQMTADVHSKRHKELLKSIVSHQSEFYKFHRLKRQDANKLARQIRDQHRKAEAAKEKDADQAEKARIAALRSNDMAAYTSLLNDTKNERLKFLLDKTDECMNQISTLLSSRVAEEEEDIKQMGGEGRIKATFSESATGGSYYETAHVKSEQVRQPSILTGGDLKEYQLAGLQWLVSLYNNRLNGILADEMGLGKTIQTISLLAYLIEVKQNLGPFLVIVPLSTLSNWGNEFAKWLPAANVICYKGTPQQRKQLFRDEVAEGHFNVLLTTYEFVIRDKGTLKKLAWQYAIVDEGHRMKNNQSKFSVTLATHYSTRRRVLLTGTPLQNSLPELWALLNFLLPAIFNSADTFDQWFNKPFASFGKTSSAEDGDTSNELLSNEERMLIIHRLHELLRPFMLRRVKNEVLDQLPTKVEKILRCELSSWQKELYKQISRKIAGEAATKNFNRGLNNVVMQLRKVCNHPYLFSKDGYHINEDVIRTSGKVELLDRMLPKLKAAGHRILMFTQMTKMMPILEDYFAYRGFSSLRLDGSTTADEREKRMYQFNAPDSPYFIFLLSTRAGGLGLNLATADTVIIFDSDWNPMMDLQAQDRAHRIGQRKDVRVFRIITQTPVEEKILSRATEKLQMNELVVEAGKFDKSGHDESSLERLKMMELLLTDFDQNQSAQESRAATSEEDFEKDTDAGDEEENKDLLNEMISGNDDDYQLYCKMDLDRTGPALYNDLNDCPDWIRYPNGKPEEGEEFMDAGQPEVLGQRRAAAGQKMYDDGLTEKQFCRMMDKQADQEEKGKKKRKKKRSHNALDPSLILENDGSGRKRTKTTHTEIDDTPSRRGAAALSAGKAALNGEVTAAMYDRLLSVTRSIIYFKDKASKRRLSEIFLEKPCPQTYPDYYQIIDNPIGMNDILRKCRAKLYSTINEFRDDWNTLFANAKTYNGEGSWIVLDAQVLRGELDRLMDKNALSATAAATKKPVRIKLSLKNKKKKASPVSNGASSETPPPATLKMSASTGSLSKSGDSGDESDSVLESTSDIVGMVERQNEAKKRGKNRSGGLGSRGGTTRLVRRGG